jgi:hypothetical protein
LTRAGEFDWALFDKSRSQGLHRRWGEPPVDILAGVDQ